MHDIPRSVIRVPWDRKGGDKGRPHGVSLQLQRETKEVPPRHPGTRWNPKEYIYKLRTDDAEDEKMVLRKCGRSHNAGKLVFFFFISFLVVPLVANGASPAVSKPDIKDDFLLRTGLHTSRDAVRRASHAWSEVELGFGSISFYK